MVQGPPEQVQRATQLINEIVEQVMLTGCFCQNYTKLENSLEQNLVHNWKIYVSVTSLNKCWITLGIFQN